MEHQLFQHSWQYHDTSHSPLDIDIFMGDCEFSSSLNITEDSSDVSSTIFFQTMSPDELLSVPMAIFSSEQYSPNSSDLDFNSNNEALSDEFENAFDWIQEMEVSNEISLHSQQNMNFTEEQYEVSLNSSINTTDVLPDIASVQSPIVLPEEDMEVDNQFIIPYLLKAYGEAIENEQPELEDVISRRIKEKASPMGSTLERLSYYLFQTSDKQDDETSDKQDDYLQQEAHKNYGAAFKAFYQILPHGKFAHLTANLAILESIPVGAETIHIIEFDMGNGVQLPPLIESLGRGRAVRVTSIKLEEGCDSSEWSFQDTKKRLHNHAKCLGVKLAVEEMQMEELVMEKRNMKTLDTQKEWLVFNCMVGLPHLGRQRNRRVATEFLKVAKNLIHVEGDNSTRGIITLAEGDGIEERIRTCSEFGSFLDESIAHLHSMLQSIEGSFHPQLTEARIALECLFLAPYISSSHCFGKWGETRKVGSWIKTLSKMERSSFSRQNLLQAMEIAKEGNSMYSVKLEGVNQNQMSLEWRGTPLIKVSSWR